MNNLLRRVFFADQPARGAFFGAVLLFFTPWFWANWSVLSGSFETHGGIRVSLFFVSFLAAALLIWGFLLIFRFLSSPERGKGAPLFFLLCGLCLVAGWGFMTPLIWIWHKFCTGNLGGALSPDNMKLLTAGTRALTAAGIVLWAAGILAAVRACTGGGVSFRGILGREILILAGTAVFFYLLSFFLALHAESSANRNLADLEKYFGRPLTLKDVGERYFRGEKPSPSFWKQANFLYHLYREFTSKAPSDFSNCTAFHSNNSTADIPDATFDRWENCLRGSSAVKRFEEHFSASIPPDPGLGRNFVFCLRPYLELQAWRAFFAARENDTAAAVKALAEAEKAFDAWLRAPFGSLFYSDFKVCCRTLEYVLTCLDEKELQRQKRVFAKFREQYAAAQEECDLAGWASADRELFLRFYGKYAMTIPLSPYRWLFPPFLHCYAVNRGLLFLGNRGRTAAARAERKKKLLRRYGSRMILTRQGGIAAAETPRYRQACETLLLVTEKLVEVELFRRRTGKLPDSLPGNTIDPFTGNSLFYAVGKLPVRVPVDTQGSIRNRKIDAVAVWSAGPNGRNDGGLCKKIYPFSGDNIDDIRALMPLR